MKKILLLLCTAIIMIGCTSKEDEPKTYNFDFIYASNFYRDVDFTFVTPGGKIISGPSLTTTGTRYDATISKNVGRVQFCSLDLNGVYYTIPSTLIIYDTKRNKIAELTMGTEVSIICNEDGTYTKQ